MRLANPKGLAERFYAALVRGALIAADERLPSEKTAAPAG
jgi:hypothetical protein